VRKRVAAFVKASLKKWHEHVLRTAPAPDAPRKTMCGRLKLAYKKRHDALMEEISDPDEAVFKKNWDSPRDSETGKLITDKLAQREARQLIIQQLHNDFEERRGSLRSVAQEAAATAHVVALMLVGFGLIVQGKSNVLQTPQAKTMACLLAVAIILMTNAYMPRFFKSVMTKFEGAGEWASRVTTTYAYANRMRKDLNIRNRVLERARKRQAGAKLLIQVAILFAGIFILLA
jgi:hypothetical protein